MNVRVIELSDGETEIYDLDTPLVDKDIQWI